MRLGADAERPRSNHLGTQRHRQTIHLPSAPPAQSLTRMPCPPPANITTRHVQPAPTDALRLRLCAE